MREKAWRYGEERKELRPDGSEAVGTACGEYVYDHTGRLVGHLNVSGFKPLYERRGKTCYGCVHRGKDISEDETPCYWCAVGFTDHGILGCWESRKADRLKGESEGG